jgi:peptidase S41-like protein
MALDSDRRAEVVDRVLRAVEQRHVDPATGERIAVAVRERMAAGAYDAAATGRDLAARLTADLRAAGDDPLLEVVFRGPASDGEDRAPADPAAAAHANFGFERAQLLPPNVGHVVIRGLHPPDVPDAAHAATAAMAFVTHASALILDVRENAGGAPSMATFLASFLFAEPVHLNTIAGRPGAPEHQNWTSAQVPGPRFLRPVYVLTSARTFGAAEGLAYHLQARERAMVIGERTRGTGGLVEATRVDPEFEVLVTTGRSVSPVTGTSWHGTGVVPDLEVAPDDALRAAHQAARRRPAPDDPRSPRRTVTVRAAAVRWSERAGGSSSPAFDVGADRRGAPPPTAGLRHNAPSPSPAEERDA